MKIFFPLIVFALPLIANEQINPMRVKVHGMVCSFCARGLNSVLKKQKMIEKFEIDVEKGEFHYWLKPQSHIPSESTIRKWVEEAGLEAVKLND